MATAYVRWSVWLIASVASLATPLVLLADPTADRLTSLYGALDVAAAHQADAWLAWAAGGNRTAAVSGLTQARAAVLAAHAEAQTPAGAADLGKATRKVAGSLAKFAARLGAAGATLDDPHANAKAVERALAQAGAAAVRTAKTLAKVRSLGPAMHVLAAKTKTPGAYPPNSAAVFLVTTLDGAGAPCPALAAAVTESVTGVAAAAPSVGGGIPQPVSLSLGSAQGIAELTLTACGVQRKVYVVCRGTGGTTPPPVELLAWVEAPANLCTGGGWLCWADNSEDPVKAMPTVGGTVRSLAMRLQGPERLLPLADGLLCLDVRDGFSPGGSVGPEVVRALKKLGLGTADSRTLATGGNAAHFTSLDLAAAGDHAFWVISEATPDTYTIQAVPLGGGPAADLYVSVFQPITALAADGSWLYWVEGVYPDPGRIIRMPTAGGTPAVLFGGSLPVAPMLAADGDRLLFVTGGMPHSYRLMAIPLAGGDAGELALLPDRPVRLAAENGTAVWVDGSAVRALPPAKSGIVTLADGRDRPTDVGIDAGVVFWAESPAAAPGVGGVAAVPLAGGGVIRLGDAATPTSLVVVGERVYWAEGGPIARLGGYGRVDMVNRAGGDVGTAFAGISMGTPPLAAAAWGVCVGDRWTVKRLPFDGSPMQFLAGADAPIADVATNGAAVVWIESDPFGTLRAVPASGGAVQTLGSVNDLAGRVAVDAANAYALGGLGRIHRFPLAGGASTVIADGGIVDDLAAAASGLVYSDLANNAVYRVAAGSPPLWLTGFLADDWSCRLAADASWVYWVTPNMAAMTPLAGGPTTLLMEPLDGDPGMIIANSIAADADAVYFTVLDDTGLGAILRSPRR